VEPGAIGTPGPAVICGGASEPGGGVGGGDADDDDGSENGGGGVMGCAGCDGCDDDDGGGGDGDGDVAIAFGGAERATQTPAEHASIAGQSSTVRHDKPVPARSQPPRETNAATATSAAMAHSATVKWGIAKRPLTRPCFAEASRAVHGSRSVAQRSAHRCDTKNLAFPSKHPETQEDKMCDGVSGPSGSCGASSMTRGQDEEQQQQDQIQRTQALPKPPMNFPFDENVNEIKRQLLRQPPATQQQPPPDETVPSTGSKAPKKPQLPELPQQVKDFIASMANRLRTIVT
jgi:hypothetical protein